MIFVILGFSCAPPPAAMPPPAHYSMDWRQEAGLGGGVGISIFPEQLPIRDIRYANTSQLWWYYRMDAKNTIGLQATAQYLHDAIYNPILGGGLFYRHALQNDEKKIFGLGDTAWFSLSQSGDANRVAKPLWAGILHTKCNRTLLG